HQGPRQEEGEEGLDGRRAVGDEGADRLGESSPDQWARQRPEHDGGGHRPDDPASWWRTVWCASASPAGSRWTTTSKSPSTRWKSSWRTCSPSACACDTVSSGGTASTSS